jgi:nucleotide-binding universal stress UspA family protein
MSIFPAEILLATDGSEGANLAAGTAAEIAAGTDSELYLVTVFQKSAIVYPYYEVRFPEAAERYLRRAREEIQKVLDEQAERIRKSGAEVAGANLKTGEPVAEIVALAEDMGVGLIVLGSRGLGGVRRALVGSVSTGVLRHAHCSVLIVRGRHGEGQAHSPDKILVAVDGSEEATAATQTATEMAEAFGSEVHVAYALQEERYRPHLGPEMWEGWEEDFERAKRSARSWVEGEAQRMKGEGTIEVKPHLLIGRPDAAIVWLAGEIGADLVLAGSRGLGAMRRALLGSVSDSVARHAHCPVMVVRKEKER